MQQIQTAPPTLAKLGRLAGAVYLLSRGTRNIDHGERIQVTLVGGAGHRMIAVEIGHAFVHGAPAHAALPLAETITTDSELTWLVAVAKVLPSGPNATDGY